MKATKSIAKERVTKILMEPWSGANFSESIWSNRDKLAGVVRTERSHAVNKAKLEQYKDTGFEYYKYKAAIGQNRTCERCRKVHKESEKEAIKLSEAVEGENFPPLHPNCRCTVVPFMSNTIISKEDRKDFEKFKKAGVDVPDNIEDFVKIKYNEDEIGWKNLQLKYEIRTEYNLKIRKQKQLEHRKGNKQGKSYLLDEIDPQELVDIYAGTGEIRRDDNGEFIKKQMFYADKVIGFDVDPNTGEKTPTRKFSIDYAKKKGTHVIPRKERPDDRYK